MVVIIKLYGIKICAQELSDIFSIFEMFLEMFHLSLGPFKSAKLHALESLQMISHTFGFAYRENSPETYKSSRKILSVTQLFKSKRSQNKLQDAPVPNYHPPSHLLTGVKCRTISVAKKNKKLKLFPD